MICLLGELDTDIRAFCTRGKVFCIENENRSLTYVASYVSLPPRHWLTTIGLVKLCIDVGMVFRMAEVLFIIFLPCTNKEYNEVELDKRAYLDTWIV